MAQCGQKRTGGFSEFGCPKRLCELRVTAHGEEIDDRVGCGRGVRQTVEEACYWLLAKTVATNHSNLPTFFVSHKLRVIMKT